MDNSQTNSTFPGGLACLLASIASAFLAWISVKEVQVIAAIVASGFAVLAAIMSIRYYWFATKKIIQEK